MNDLRSSSQAVDTGSEAAAGISSTPPRNRPDRVAERGAKKMSRRQSIAERARQEAVAEAAADSVDGQHDESIELTEVAAGTDGAPDGETLVDDETL
ncbi:MAG: hypothetical protein OER95_13560, partial [Acidimicrobiia bacterium]|nr:hypothetical protein [Acidimicrobiia bacterium]